VLRNCLPACHLLAAIPGAARFLVDWAIDRVRHRFGSEAVDYGSALRGGARSVPDGFRELAEKEL
jgi:DNA polymerase IV